MSETKPTLANLAAKNKTSKPSKAEAQKAIKDIDAAIMEGADLSEYRDILADLYLYFMPPAPKKAKTAWEWVALAMAKKDYRDYLNYIYVNERHIVASDGHRLHLMPNHDNLEPGYYLANGDKAHEPDWRQYPDYERIIPRKGRTVAETITETPERVEQGPVHAYKMPWTEEYGLNTQYMDAALMLDQYPVTLYRDSENEPTAVLFESGDRVAVVMPIKII